jgi:hypothetical protein
MGGGWRSDGVITRTRKNDDHESDVVCATRRCGVSSRRVSGRRLYRLDGRRGD